jgi:hypothetical protein
LKLYGVKAGFFGFLDETKGQFQRAVVVDADLGDEKARLAGANFTAVGQSYDIHAEDILLVFK